MATSEERLPKRLSSERVLAFANAVWKNNPSVAVVMAAKASRMIKIAYEKTPAFFSGKSERGILSGLFYQLSLNTAYVKTQKEIAVALATTEATARASHRSWIACFPDSFLEITKCEKS